MKKTVIRIALGLVVLLVVLLAVAWLMIDSLAKAGIERGGTNALGVQTTVESVNLSLLRGRLKTTSLRFANAPGFSAPFLMTTGDLHVGVDSSSLFGETVRVNEFTITGLEMNIEQTLRGNNVSAVMDNVRKRSTGEEPPPAEEEPEKAGRKVSVDRIYIRDVVANVTISLPGQEQKLSLTIPEIELTEVTSDNASGVAVAELTRRIFLAVVAAVLEQGQGKLPPFLTQDLSQSLSAATQAAGAQAQKVLQDVQSKVQGQVEQLRGTIERQPEAATQELRRGLEDILRRPQPQQ